MYYVVDIARITHSNIAWSKSESIAKLYAKSLASRYGVQLNSKHIIFQAFDNWDNLLSKVLPLFETMPDPIYELKEHELVLLVDHNKEAYGIATRGRRWLFIQLSNGANSLVNAYPQIFNTQRTIALALFSEFSRLKERDIDIIRKIDALNTDKMGFDIIKYGVLSSFSDLLYKL